ncbi:MAG TPA: sigma-70 family RNA polymerase sigma factor [Acidimicrobiia bacterium]
MEVDAGARRGRAAAARSPVSRHELAAFSDLYREQIRPLTALAFSLTGRWHVAEELVQDVFASALARWPRVRRMDHPDAWLRRAVANRCASHFRRGFAERRAISRVGAASDIEHDAPDQVDDHLWVLVRRLPRRQSQAVALRYALDLSRKEVALTMRCSEEAVKTHVKRATAALRTMIDDEERANEDD